MELSLLSAKDHSCLQQIDDFFEDLQLGMSAFQIRHFVLNDESFPLPDSKYHQAKLELYTRWQKTADLEYAFRKNVAKSKLFEARRLKWESALDTGSSHERLEAEAQIELLEIEREELRAARLSLQKSCAETVREIRVFLAVVEEMRPQLRYDSKEAAEPEHWLAVQASRQRSAPAERPLPGRLTAPENEGLLTSR